MNHLSNLPESLSIAFADLPLEILVNITEFLSTKDILNLSICSRRFYDILYTIKINDKVKFEKISGLSYFDSFTNVTYDKYRNRFPKSLCVLDWNCDENLPSKGLPDSLKSLNFDGYGNQPLPQLADSLKSLYLGSCYNHPFSRLPVFGLKPSLRYAQQLRCPAFDCLKSLLFLIAEG